MLEVHLLGTGGMIPLPDRYLTSLLVRYQGTGILIDCGEGTQMAIRSAGLGFKQIGVICLTHFHADHVAGLPGLFLTIGNAGRTEPLTVIGPPYTQHIVDSLCVIAPKLPFEIRYVELQGMGGKVFSVGALSLSAHPVDHWIPCYAYKLEVKRKGRFLSEQARAMRIPVRFWSWLQRGESVEVEGRHVVPAEVMGKERRGISLCYATDLRPSEQLADFASGADLFVCEGMYGNPEDRNKAVEHRHCLFTEAAQMAKQAGVGELWLTHFSPSMPDPETYLPAASAIFPNVWIHKHSTTLAFSD